MKEVQIYSDGSCLNNPGRGGYGVILVYGEHTKEISQGFTLSTNNRMEILGVIEGLKMLKEPCKVEVYTDSQYVINAIDKGWIYNWQKNGWKTANKKDVKNKDLWEIFYTEFKNHEVKFHWVKGHNGHPQNERCDEIAKEAASGSNLIEDIGYDAE